MVLLKVKKKKFSLKLHVQKLQTIKIAHDKKIIIKGVFVLMLNSIYRSSYNDRE